uniref:Uncharacterized protein n=1 Tax=Periophthalmus magnuspinnatus TaxID=409849 RepID=A0A3B3ZFB8_9GOBI
MLTDLSVRAQTSSGFDQELWPRPVVQSELHFENSNMYCLFIQVFSLVFLQLLFTFCVVCIFTFSSTVKELVQSSIWVYVSAYIVFAVVVVPLSLCTSLSRRHPWNLIALVRENAFVFMSSRYDFTLCYVLLLILGLDLLMFVVFSSFYYSHMADVGYGSLGALLFSLMMTGSMSHRVSPEDYVTAALIIYLDIVLIFLYLLGRR